MGIHPFKTERPFVRASNQSCDRPGPSIIIGVAFVRAGIGAAGRRGSGDRQDRIADRGVDWRARIEDKTHVAHPLLETCESCSEKAFAKQ